MFKKFKFGKNKNNHDMEELSFVEIERIRMLLRENKLPILTLDNTWYQIKEIVVDRKIESLEKDVNHYLQQQGQLTNDLKEAQVVKTKLMEKILKFSEEAQEHPDDCDDLDAARDALLKNNDIIAKLETKLTNAEQKLESINLELVENVVIKCYGFMEHHKSTRETLELEIDDLRALLLEKTEAKKQSNKDYGQLYNYLHDMMGYKYVDKLDKIVEEVEA
ncbi:MAG: hypothetical protein ATN36_04405 [Epulopiscium sp. Nele67-Bin005]|nr:MAG: hypothetical protein ATN36_04405 [Epulopiscium sp. Nele67-Bin005]